MDLTAAIGLLGVLLGSAITAFVTVYREQLTTRREREARDIQRQREREDQRQVFQRDNILALQGVLTELENAVYREQDRKLDEMKKVRSWKMKRVSSWPARQWETPTAEAWQDAFIRAEALRSRLFDDELRQLASEIGEMSRSAVWAASREDAEHANEKLRDLSARFNERVGEVLRELF
jgi:hypothetical protein